MLPSWHGCISSSHAAVSTFNRRILGLPSGKQYLLLVLVMFTSVVVSRSYIPAPPPETDGRERGVGVASRSQRDEDRRTDTTDKRETL